MVFLFTSQTRAHSDIRSSTWSSGGSKNGKILLEGGGEREREVLVRCLQPAEGCLLKVGSLDFSLAGWLAILAFHPPSNASMQSTVPFGVTTAILAS
jgi:hypothetical protein